MGPLVQQHPHPTHITQKLRDQGARVRAEMGPKSPGVILPGSLICKKQARSFICPGWGAGLRALSLYLKPPGSYWPIWLPGDRSYPTLTQGTHSPGWFIQLGPWPVKPGTKGVR